MSKRKTNKNRKQAKQTPQYDHPGRPMYDPKWPRAKEFTFRDLCEAQGMRFTAKGKYVQGSGECTPLTMRKFLKRDKASRGHSVLVLLDATADPNSRKGLGRKAHLYSLRNRVSTRTAKAPEATPADVSQSTKDYEATKAALLADTSVPVTAPVTPEATPAPAPEVTPTPAPEVTAPAAVAETAPIANETPAPQVEAAPAPVAETVPAPQS